MKKVICLSMAVLMIVCVLAGCGEAGQKETEPQVDMVFELEKERITAENVSPYKGMCLELGYEEAVSGVYAMKITNTGDRTIQSAYIVFADGSQELAFQLEMLPAGQSVTVVELGKTPVVSGELRYVDSSITYLEEGLEAPDSIELTGDAGVIRVKNITDELLPLVRIFYRQTDRDGNKLGGPCHTVLLEGIAPGETVETEVEHWNSGCAVVTVLVINQ